MADPLAELSAFEQDEETPEEKVYNDMKIYATDYLHQLHQKAITAPTDSDSDSDTTVSVGPSNSSHQDRYYYYYYSSLAVLTVIAPFSL